MTADFHFSWFITRRCNRNCRHCLRHGPDDRGPEHDAATCRRILADWLAYLRTAGKTSEMEFGGANPLLRDDLPDLLRRCKAAADEGVLAPGIRLLANPETLTAETAAFLASCGVNEMPMSLDGLEATNDAMRGMGNFAAAVHALDLLRDAGIPTWVKFTALRKNAAEFGAVRDLALAHGASKIVPGRLILEGGGVLCADEALDDAEWAAFCSANGLPERPVPPPRGASRLLVVMADGEVRPRRNLPGIGCVPRDDFKALVKALPAGRATKDRRQG